MPRLKLTDISLRSLKSPEKGQVTYWDDSLTGFGVRLSPGGAKTFIVMYGANRQRETIGRYPTIKLADARQEAKAILAKHTLGRHRLPSITFQDAQDRFLVACEAKNRPRTVQGYKRLLNRHFRLGRVLLQDLTPQDLSRRLNKLISTPSEQHHAFVALRTFLNWCVREGYLEANPVAHMHRPPPRPSRERTLSLYELGALYSHATAYPYPYGPIVALLLLTGQRRGEIAALQWDWLAEDTITFPADVTKNRRQHTIPYGRLATQVLETIPETSTYLFPARSSHVKGKPTAHFNGWGKAKLKFDEGLQIAPYTLHDLRRSYASTLSSLGVPIHVTEKLLNHVSGAHSGVAGIYNRYDYLPEMRQAVSQFDEHLERHLNE